MTVRELSELLDAKNNWDLEIVVRCNWEGETPAHNEFYIEHVVGILEPDTGDSVIVIECGQHG